MPLSYRLSETRDLNAVFDLYMDTRSNPFLTFDPMSIEAFALVFDQMLHEKNLFVALTSDEIIATYRLIQKAHRQSHILYLGGFTVKSSMKGKGFGFEILQHIKSTAEQDKFTRIELTVDTENHAAINLYRKVGFEIEGKLKNNYRLSSTGQFYDEYVMALLLR